MSPEQLLTQYNNENERVTLAEKALEDARNCRANTLKTFLEAYGSGPHVVGGEKKVIMRKPSGDGFTYFFKKTGPRLKGS